MNRNGQKTGKCFRMSVGPACGRVAQLGEHLLCKQGVRGSNPLTSTKHLPAISVTYYEAWTTSFSSFPAP